MYILCLKMARNLNKKRDWTCTCFCRSKLFRIMPVDLRREGLCHKCMFLLEIGHVIVDQSVLVDDRCTNV